MPPLVLPRNLIIFAFVWLVVSWLQALGLRPPIYATAPSYEPGVRMMLLYLMIGLVVAWPLYRLSQKPSPWPIRQTLLDLMVLLSMAQVVVWPLRLVTSWTREETAAMDATLIAWGILIGAIVVVGIGARRIAVRSAAMLVCVALALFGPTATWIVASFGARPVQIGLFSPILIMHDLGATSVTGPSHAQWSAIAIVFGGGLLAWAALAVGGAIRQGQGVSLPDGQISSTGS